MTATVRNIAVEEKQRIQKEHTTNRVINFLFIRIFLILPSF